VIAGTVTDNGVPIIMLLVAGQTWQGIIDTGFNGELELRAAMSLAQLGQHQSRHADAHALPAPVYGWFTEGFDTADLQEAKSLLAGLS
jgi:hypothetical protein